MGVKADRRAVLHEVSPDADVEVEGVVHEEEPVWSLFSYNVVAVPVIILRSWSTAPKNETEPSVNHATILPCDI